LHEVGSVEHLHLHRVVQHLGHVVCNDERRRLETVAKLT
jgi:hypothetical protein